jgi:hypothetical protein
MVINVMKRCHVTARQKLAEWRQWGADAKKDVGMHVMSFNLSPQEKYGLPCAHCNETYKCSTALCRDPLHWISPKLNNKCGEHRHNLIYAPKCEFHCAKIMKLITIQQISVDISCSGFHLYQTRSIKNAGNISFILLIKICLSLIWFSWIQACSDQISWNLTNGIVTNTWVMWWSPQKT